MPPTRLARISGISFENFKAFEQYLLSLEQVNILGAQIIPGNPLLLVRSALLIAALSRSRSPQRVQYGDVEEIGYLIPKDSLPISLENVHTNYNFEISTITFRISNRIRLRLVFPDDGRCVLVPDVEGEIIRSAAVFKQNFSISLTVVPGGTQRNKKREEHGN